MSVSKILAIDDEATIRQLLDEELTDEGYDVITTGQVDGLLEIIEKEKPDLIILDIKLGTNSSGREINGLDLLQKIRLKFHDLPVILLTAYDHFRGTLKAFAADYYVTKSYDFSQLKTSIKKAFETKIFREKKSIEEAKKERDTLWRDISFKAAHKIGNPIFAIETEFQSLKSSANQSNRSISRFLQVAEPALVKAKLIIEQFKSFAKATDISLSPVAIKPLVEDSCRVAQSKNVKVNIEVSEEPASVMADAGKLTECFDELIMNAVSWFDKSEKKITILITRPPKEDLPLELDPSNSYLKILFEDNGCGIPIESKSKIFDAFFTNKPNGTGLGLAVVGQIIQVHSGLILEKGNPGIGAVFEIYLPISEET